MRNVAFSILLFALAIVQIAVVTAELPKAHAQPTTVQTSKPAARVVLATNETQRKTSTY